MVKFKLNIADPKTGRTTTVELDEPYSRALLNKRIGDEIEGSLVGLKYKKLRITGGTDRSGVPMRADVAGGRKTYILTGIGVGLRKPRTDVKGKKKKAYRKRILVRGDTITPDIYQVNMVIVEE
ncbi:MAG: S6e family ribosomal protein [Candidatus Geothermarchaeota archaeon]